MLGGHRNNDNNRNKCSESALFLLHYHSVPYLYVDFQNKGHLEVS